jgi:hypothetical protein
MTRAIQIQTQIYRSVYRARLIHGQVTGLLKAPTKPTEDVVMQTFTEAMNILSSFMQRLIVEAEVNLPTLINSRSVLWHYMN